MDDIISKLEAIDWEAITQNLNEKGFALAEAVLSVKDCENLKVDYDQNGLYRKTVIMERHRFGLGAYKYFNYPLPPIIQAIREKVYTHLAPVANSWMRALNIDKVYPPFFEEFRAICQDAEQVKPTVLILKYGPGGYNTMHQDIYGDVFFPIQLVLFLSEPGTDFTGGEFVLTEQVPRAQSKAMVLTPKKGDMLIFTTNFRPVKGTKGYYRVNMKHGISELHSGERYSLGIIFHDAIS